MCSEEADAAMPVAYVDELRRRLAQARGARPLPPRQRRGLCIADDILSDLKAMKSNAVLQNLKIARQIIDRGLAQTREGRWD
jgi:Xaa-Pro aminopeptidase